jgi:hypothetical protein
MREMNTHVKRRHDQGQQQTHAMPAEALALGAEGVSLALQALGNQRPPRRNNKQA